MAKKKVEEVMDSTDDLMSIVEFSENIADAEEPEPLPESEYPAEITAAEVKTSATKGTKYASVTFRIQEQDYPADFPAENAPGGKNVRFMVGMEDNPPARFRLKRFLEAVGAPRSKRINVTEWIGLSAKVTIKHDEYEGVVREQVARVTEG